MSTHTCKHGSLSHIRIEPVISNAQNQAPLRYLLKYMKTKENWLHVEGSISTHVVHSEG